MRRWPAIVLSLAVLLWAPPAAPEDLSGEQVRLLERGEVLVLDVLPPGPATRATQGGTAIGLVQGSAADVWRVLTDYPRHPGLYPNVTTSEVLESDPARTVLPAFLTRGAERDGLVGALKAVKERVESRT
jgi:hypothetical protein